MKYLIFVFFWLHVLGFLYFSLLKDYLKINFQDLKKPETIIQKMIRNILPKIYRLTFPKSNSTLNQAQFFT